MRRILLVTLAVAMGISAGDAWAQGSPRRKSVAVKDFEYGTLDHWWGQYNIGKGMADQVVEALLMERTFRVIERKNLDVILGEQDFAHSDRAAPGAARQSKMGKMKGVDFYLVGSITKFSMEQKGGGMRVKGLRLGGGRAKAEVNLTARLIDTSTGEVIASATGRGESKKVTGVSFGKGGTGLDMGSREFRDSGLGAAQEDACQQLVQELVAAYLEVAGQ